MPTHFFSKWVYCGKTPNYWVIETSAIIVLFAIKFSIFSRFFSSALFRCHKELLLRVKITDNFVVTSLEVVDFYVFGCPYLRVFKRWAGRNWFPGEFNRMIICEAKVASEEKAVKGFRGINPQSIHAQAIYSTIP